MKNNKFTIEENDLITFQVSRICPSLTDDKDRNQMQIRCSGGHLITMPETWFERMCDWYYQNHK